MADTRAALAPEAVPITFGKVRADCVLLGRRSDAAAVEARINEIARNRLPQAIAVALSPVLQGLGGVIRINVLSLDISLRRDALRLDDLARLWARRIAEALGAEIGSHSGMNVAIFADHGDFAAAYLEMRFGEANHPEWAFPDFAALRYLAPGQAAVEILRTRPEYLPAIARRGALRVRPDRLAERLSPGQIDAVLAAHAPDLVIAAQRDEITRIILDLLLDLGFAEWRAVGAHARPLAFALSAMATDTDIAPATLLCAGRVVSALVSALSETGAPSEMAGGQPAETALARLRTAPSRTPSGGLAAWLADAAGRAALRKILVALSAARAATADEAGSETLKTPAPSRKTPDDDLVASPFAGVALCLGTIRRLDLHTVLSPQALHAAAVALVDPKLQPLARTDPALARLFPADPHLPFPEWPALGPHLPDGLSQDQRDAIGAATGAESWALLVLARFALSLPGFGASSAGYMRRQFLHIGGVLHWMPGSVEITLDPIPLGIVLSMAGATGWQGTVPWLGNRDLTIRIRGQG